MLIIFQLLKENLSLNLSLYLSLNDEIINNTEMNNMK